MLVLVASCVVTLAVAPVVRRVLLRFGVLDVPNSRSSHATPVPRGGGMACVLGAAAGLGVAGPLDMSVPWLALSGALLLAGVGFADDRRALPPLVRLGAQVGGGALMGAAIGGGAWILAGAVCAPVVVNAVNFMDGINGITSLNMIAWGAVAMVAGGIQGASELVVVGAVTAGSALGFLPWNAPVARLFLGDVGSYLFGAMATVGILTSAHGPAGSLILVAPLAIYLADTGMSLLRRGIRREPLMNAHREHVFQRLVDRGRLPHVLVAAVTVVLSLAIVAAWHFGSTTVGVATTVIIVALYVALPALVEKGAEPRVRPNGGLT